MQSAFARVPASTSNLGAGFDALGMAVRRYLDARYEPGEEPLALVREGTLADLDVDPEDDLVVTAFRAEAARLGVTSPGGRLVVRSEIPVGIGLGTSAAATLAGLLLASAAAGETDPDRTALLDRAVAVEGHGDNAAAELLGGLVGVGPRPDSRVRAVRLRLSPEVAFAFAAPPVRVSTRAARAALPDAYPRRTAVASLGRLTCLLHGLAEGDGEALSIGLEDEIHVPYRLGLVPGGRETVDAAREVGAWGATLSGSGSGVIALCAGDRIDAVLDAMVEAFRAAGQAPQAAFRLEPDLRGAVASETAVAAS